MGMDGDPKARYANAVMTGYPSNEHVYSLPLRLGEYDAAQLIYALEDALGLWYLVLMFVNIMTYFEGRFPLSLAHSRAGGADAAPEPIRHRVEQDRTRGTHSQGTEVYVTISRCHPREDRPVRGRGLGQ